MDTLQVQVISIPLALFGAIVGLVVMLINLKIGSPLIWLAASFCFIGVYFDETVSDSYYAIAAGILIIACWLMGFYGWRRNRRGG